MNRRRRAMTILELLTSLVLLAVLIGVCTAWMTASLRQRQDAVGRTKWERAALATLDLIGRDLINIEGLDPQNASRTPRVVGQASQLEIRTRDRGRLGVMRYGIDRRGGLRRVAAGAREEAQSPPLLGEIASFTAEITMPSEAHALPVLRVSIGSVRGDVIGRAYTLTAGDVQ